MAASSETVISSVRMTQRSNFVKRQKANPETVHQLVFAVKQMSLQYIDQLLLERSSPGSQYYQQWLTFDEVGSIVTNVDGARSTLDWLKEGAQIVWVSKRQEYIKAQATISVWNSLLQTEFYLYEDLSSKIRKNRRNRESTTVHRADSYSLPHHIQPHVSSVFHTVQVPPELHKKYHSHPAKVSLSGNSDGVTVPFLNSYYNITASNSSYGQQQAIFETDDAYYSPDDLTLFQETFDLPVREALHPYGFAAASCVNHDCFEGNLDIQYIMGVARHTQSVYWYTEDTPSGDPFVDWITAVANTPNPPLSNSISWEVHEQTLTTDIMEAFNTEAMKLAVMGVTIVVAAGDAGASSGVTRCPLYSGSEISHWQGQSSWTGKGYFPSFPATSPYVTAVGATMGPESGGPEIVCQSQLGGVITSGGGFSTYYPAPSWQTDAVAKYFSSLAEDQQPTAGYNMHGRAYPDVSLVGVKYQVVVAGQVLSMYGTSASAPVFAAMISLVNAERAAQNKTSVGFINPTLYARGGLKVSSAGGARGYPYNDVISGHNKCTVYNGATPSDAFCCDSGFHAAQGWDPVSGFGSIDFHNLVAMFDTSDNTTTAHTAPHNIAETAKRDELIATCVIVGGIICLVMYFVLNGVFCAKPVEHDAATPAPGSAALTVVEAQPIAIPTTARYRRVTSAEAAVIQLDEECISVSIEIV